MKIRVSRVWGLLRINGNAGLVSELEKENRLADSLALMEWILSRSSTHASKPKHRVACHREIGHPSHRALPSNGIHSSSCMKTFVLRVGRWWTITSQDEEDYEDDGNHDILISTITSRTGSYQSMPLVVRGKPGGHLPDDLWSWEVSLTKGPERGTRPSFRKKERTLFEQAHSNGCGGHTSTAKCLPRKSWGKAPLLKARVSRDVRNVHSFDGIFFQNKILHHVE